MNIKAHGIAQILATILQGINMFSGFVPAKYQPVVAFALTIASSVQSMPYVPLQQPNNSVIPVRQGCGLGRQLVEGICVRNSAVRAAVRKCSSRRMRMVNGRCEPRARPAAAPAAARPAAAPAAAPPTTQQPAATPATPR